MTGTERAFRRDSLEGIRTALHLHPALNSGDTISLIVEDDCNDPALTVKAYQKPVDVDEVVAILLLSISTDLVKNSSGIDRKLFSHGKFDRNWTLACLSFQFSVLSSQSALREFAVTAH